MEITILSRQLLWALIAFLLGFEPTLVAVNIPQDLQGLQTVTTWRVSEPNWKDAPAQCCGIKNLDRYARVRMDHEVASDLNDAAATHQVEVLDRKIVGFLKERGWSRMNVGLNRGEIPNVKRCYQKQEAIVQIYQTTGRCTMNTPCTAYDGFTITLYLPGK